MPGRSSTVIEVLRTTLKRLEQTNDFTSDDRALRELKSSITRTIADLEFRSNPALCELRLDHFFKVGPRRSRSCVISSEEDSLAHH